MLEGTKEKRRKGEKRRREGGRGQKESKKINENNELKMELMEQ